jgi:hypothetical protein
METPESVWLSVFIRLVLLYLFADHLEHVYKVWKSQKDTSTLRQVLLAMMIFVGVLTLFVGALSRAHSAVPYDLAVIMGYIASGSLLLVGIFLWILWRR